MPITEENEVSVVVSPGARVAGFPAKVKSLSSYNVYNVRMVEIGPAGTLPIEIGNQMEAVNLAESFLSTGGLSVGTYIVVMRIGKTNIFWVSV